jgi:hypothetical protein
MVGATLLPQASKALLLITAQPFPDGGHGSRKGAGGWLDAFPASVVDQTQSMVISVSHLTDQVEITGSGHERILSGARGPALPPAGPPTPFDASGSCTATLPGGYDEPFQFHSFLQIAKPM